MVTTLIRSHRYPIDPCQFRWPWVTSKGGTRETQLFQWGEEACFRGSATPLLPTLFIFAIPTIARTVWPRTTEVGMVTCASAACFWRWAMPFRKLYKWVARFVSNCRVSCFFGTGEGHLLLYSTPLAIRHMHTQVHACKKYWGEHRINKLWRCRRQPAEACGQGCLTLYVGPGKQARSACD